MVLPNGIAGIEVNVFRDFTAQRNIVNLANFVSDQVLIFVLSFSIVYSRVDFITSVKVLAVRVEHALLELAIGTAYSAFPVVTSIRFSAVMATWPAYINFCRFCKK